MGIYKKHEIIALPTTEKSYIGYLTQKGLERNDLRFYDRLMPQILDSVNIHLYFVSLDIDDINDGDLVIVKSENGIFNNEIRVFSNDSAPPPYVCNKNICKKIVGSTDSKLNLPEPSKELIFDYVESRQKENNHLTYVNILFTSAEDHNLQVIFEEDNYKVITLTKDNTFIVDVENTLYKDSTYNPERIYTEEDLAERIFDFIHSHEDIIMNGGKYNNIETIKEWVKNESHKRNIERNTY